MDKDHVFELQEPTMLKSSQICLQDVDSDAS